ncbi:uridine phosphorylase [Ruminococcaceae bacterium OttesenSCG-928-N02]|nr:uridine phosphorylase [Ruminococcaceae bacterium OttesenSCG-928-N02]
MSEVLYHINMAPEDIEGAKYAILPGDPDRVPKIAALMQDAKPVTHKREYNTYLGTIAGEKVVVMSTGIGGPSAAIAIEELYQLGVRTFIRVGTSGGMQMNIIPGDIIVVTGAIRMEGTSKEYMPIEFPAVPDFDCTLALRNSAKKLQAPYHMGVVQCKDAYYGQHAPQTKPVSYELLNKWDAWVKGGTLASEMESAALFTVTASLPGARAGACMLCVWNQERHAAGIQDPEQHDTQLAIKVALGALEELIKGEE